MRERAKAQFLLKSPQKDGERYLEVLPNSALDIKFDWSKLLLSVADSTVYEKVLACVRCVSTAMCLVFSTRRRVFEADEALHAALEVATGMVGDLVAPACHRRAAGGVFEVRAALAQLFLVCFQSDFT